MTRVNCVPVEMLSNKHLVAEWYELPRVITLAENRCRKLDWEGVLRKVPVSYRMGTGHMQFFVDKLQWVTHRLHALYKEQRKRGFNPDPLKLQEYSIRALDVPVALYGDWEPKYPDMRVNLNRLIERDPRHYVKYRGYYGW